MNEEGGKQLEPKTFWQPLLDLLVELVEHDMRMA